MATASKVLAALKDEGLVRTRPGEGTVVAGAAPSRRPRANARVRDTEVVLSKERIVKAATHVADKEGLGPLSMRRVAVELDVATMSLYRHVKDKDDLLTAMVDAAFAEWQAPPKARDGWQETLAEAALNLWQIFRRHPWLAPAYSITRPLIVPSGLAYSELVLATLLDRGLEPATAFSMHLILFSYVRGFATSLEMEATAEADTGVTADEWMDVQKPALEALLVDQDRSAFRAVLDSFEPGGFDLDLDELFETGLGYLLDGFRTTIGDPGDGQGP